MVDRATARSTIPCKDPLSFTGLISLTFIQIVIVD